MDLDSRIIHIRTLRKVDGCPIAVIEQYFANLNWWPVLQNFKSGSLHQFLRDNLGVTLTRSNTRISTHFPNNSICRLLQNYPYIAVTHGKNPQCDQWNGNDIADIPAPVLVLILMNWLWTTK